MKEFNLSDWALKNQALVFYLLCALLLAGLFSYTQLAQKEDPDFTFKVMTIKLLWPGASARQIEQQVTDRVERKLQETPWLDNVSSYSRAGEAVIFVTLKDAMPPAELEHSWNQVRKALADIRGDLPDGIAEPAINDNFGITYGLIYAITSKTLSNAELAVQADKIRDQLLNVAGVNRIKVIGVQPETAAVGGIFQRAFLQRFRKRLQRSERRPQFVGDIGDKVAPDGFQPAQTSEVLEQHQEERDLRVKLDEKFEELKKAGLANKMNV